MYCPECGAEYREGFDDCADCGVALVKEPPERLAEINAPFEEVLRTADRALLPVVQSVLNGAGIPFSIAGDEAAALLPVATARHLSVIIRVPANLAEEARGLLEAVPEAAAPDREDLEDQVSEDSE